MRASRGAIRTGAAVRAIAASASATVSRRRPALAPDRRRPGSQPPGQRRPRPHERRRSRAPTPSTCATRALGIGRQRSQGCAASWLAWRAKTVPSTSRSRPASPSVIRRRCSRSIGPTSSAGGGMASIRSVPDPAAWGTRYRPIVRRTRATFPSANTEMVKERLVYMPQHRLLLSKNATQFAPAAGTSPRTLCG